jgi:RNA polymerase sigma factor for flagellar operon FliA
VSNERLFVDNLPVIESVIRAISHRNRLTGSDADEFASIARLRLVDNDYEVLRKFRQQSSLRTYLTVVLQRVLLDHRTARWGRWRPSMEARRRGPTGVLLEKLVTRDGLTANEAIEVLRTNHRVAEDADTLLEMFRSFPERVSRRSEDVDTLANVADGAPGPDASILQYQLAPTAERVSKALEGALATLEPEDRLIVKLRFHDGFGVGQIARALHLEQKPLYRRLERVLGQLRRELEARDLGAAETSALLDEAWSDLLEPDRAVKPAQSGAAPSAMA